MTENTRVQRHALVVVPAERASADTGDRVVVAHVVAFLREHYQCQIAQFARTGKIVKSFNVAFHLLPLELAPYWRREHRRTIRKLLAANQARDIFILHEGLFYLADEVDLESRRVTLFAHNLLSRFTIDSPVQPLIRALSLRYERRWYAKPGVRLVFISQGDRQAAADLGVVRYDAPVAPPGAPPDAPLDKTARFIPDSVLTGTYGWWRKRRDLKAFAPFGPLLRPTAFDPRVGALIPGCTILPSARDFAWSNAIRAGLITDRFAGGFKLKSLEYVANNCVVFSRAPIFGDFVGLPHAREFVVDDIPVEQWPARIARLASANQDALRARFLDFKAACLARYDWSTCLVPLLPDAEVPG